MLHELWPKHSSGEPERFSVREQWERERLEQEAAERRALQDAVADQAAVWALADFYLPADIREFGERNRIPEFAQAVWRSAFVEGWRAASRPREKIGNGGADNEAE